MKLADDRGGFRPNLACFGVPRKDPGWIYIIKSRGAYKIGKTRNPKRRLREARTWIHDMELIGVKPFWEYQEKEKSLHCGLAQYWRGGEWFEIEKDCCWILDEGFREFYDEDIDWNSVDFIYWFNSNNLCEGVMEQNRLRISIRKWQREATFS